VNCFAQVIAKAQNWSQILENLANLNLENQQDQMNLVKISNQL
jgi:hypothetical protein